MTFEKILNDVSMNLMTNQQAKDEISKPAKLKRINYFANMPNIRKEPMTDTQLQELNAIVGILQILYDSSIGSPIPNTVYDTLQEELIDMGIPRTTSSVEINDNEKVSHHHTNLRGTLDKCYYLTPDEPRTNKSRKSLDEWIDRQSRRYEKLTGRTIDFNKLTILVQPKFDGVSAVEEVEKKHIWITRGDTRSNLASDVSKIMNIFDDRSAHEPEGTGIKYEVMMPEGNFEKINEFYRENPYSDSRQVVISIFGSNEPDFKCEYLYPVPLRIMYPGDDVERIHPDLVGNFPTITCTFGDRELIRDFANKHHYVTYNGIRFRTDGAVMTILDPDVQRVLGREDNINLFEVAYKFTEESAYTKVKDVEFYLSEFGYVTPVLVVNDVIMKGKTINHISLSNRERFDELDLSYGDEVKILYDIIPYATIDGKCRRVKNGRKIKFVDRCPKCHELLDLSQVEVKCTNRKCPSRLVGRVLNYCSNLRIKNIGWRTLNAMYAVGLLDKGILSLYKLKKNAYLIEDLEGFGKLKTRKIISEIEGKRTLKDYDFFGSLGIEGLSIKTFQVIFSRIKLEDFIAMIKLKDYTKLKSRLVAVPGIGLAKSEDLIVYMKDSVYRSELLKLLQEVRLISSYGEIAAKGRIVFSGCRPSLELQEYLKNKGWDASPSWSMKAKYLIIPSEEFTSDKVEKAKNLGIPIISMPNGITVKELKEKIPDLLSE